ncbi:MAG: PEP-CTERM sorting domain-containing protein [Planctomycetota bacterium]
MKMTLNTIKFAVLAFMLGFSSSANADLVLDATNNADYATMTPTVTWNGSAWTVSGQINFAATGTTTATPVLGDSFTIGYQPARNWVPGSTGTAVDVATLTAFLNGGFDGANVEIDHVGNDIGINTNADGTGTADNDPGRFSAVGEVLIVTIDSLSLDPSNSLFFTGPSGYTNFTANDDMDFVFYDASAGAILQSNFTSGNGVTQNLNYEVGVGDAIIFAASGDGNDSWRVDDMQFDLITTVPEPSSAMLLVFSLGALIGQRRRQSNAVC